MTTFTALATRALSNDFPQTELTNAKRYVRQAVAKIYRESGINRGRIAGLYTIAANDSNATPSTPIAGLRIGRVFHADTGQELDPLDLNDLDQLRLTQIGAARTGRPRYYSLGGDSGATMATDDSSLLTWPISDRAYSVFVTGRQVPAGSDMEDTDVLMLDEVYEDLPRYYARAELFADVEDDQVMHDFWMTKFEQGAAALRADLQRGADKHRQVPGTWGLGGSSSGLPSFHTRNGLF